MSGRLMGQLGAGSLRVALAGKAHLSSVQPPAHQLGRASSRSWAETEWKEAHEASRGLGSEWAQCHFCKRTPGA